MGFQFYRQGKMRDESVEMLSCFAAILPELLTQQCNVMALSLVNCRLRHLFIKPVL